MVYFMATILGDVQYSQVMGHLPTPVINTPISLSTRLCRRHWVVHIYRHCIHPGLAESQLKQITSIAYYNIL